MIIDISHHNGQIDWTKVSKDVNKIEGVYIKTTQGVNYVDHLLIQNSMGATAAKLKVGYYHFATLNDSNVAKDAKTEAQWFITNVKKAEAPTLPLVLDIETNDGKISKDNVLLWISTFFYEIAQAGFTDYMLYSYSYFLNANLPKNHGLGKIPLWIAAYGASYKIPDGWTKAKLWQYSNSGKVNGIGTVVDLNKYV
jgi:lysozyme